MGFVPRWPNSLPPTGPQKTSKDCESHVVRRIVFDGNAYTRDRSIRRRVALSLGKPFLEEDVDKIIKTLNHWGHLKRISREDVSVAFAADDPETPDWHCFADVVIHLKEKKGPH